MTNTAPQVQPGGLFDLPGVQGQTQWFDQYEDTQALSVTWNQATSAPLLGIADFRRTDVLMNWLLHFQFTVSTFTGGAGQTLTTSAYAPYNMLGQVRLQIQNQYASVNVESGIDLYILNLIRPYRRTAAQLGVNNYANPSGDPLGYIATATGLGYLNSATPQAYLIPPTAAQWTRSTATYDLLLDLPGGIWLDEYYALTIDGNYQGAVPDLFVSPQYMAGTQRLIKPQITANPLLGSTTDTSPVGTTAVTSATSDSASTASVTAALTIRRRGVYGSSSTLVLPPTQPWQYSVTTQRFSIAGVTVTSNLKVPDNSGQVLSCWLRLFDPLAANGGAPIQLSALSTSVASVQFLYGSGLTWFSGTAEEAQALWIQQRGVLLPQGTLAFDFSVDEQNNITNKRCPNTYTTAGLQWVLTFASATSAAAYCVMGIESLVYVTG